MKKVISPKPLHESLLEMFYFESTDKPCKLTKNEVFWKFKDPSVSEYQIGEVLKWMVYHKKLNEESGHYSLDKYEALELEEKFRSERNQLKRGFNWKSCINNHSLPKTKVFLVIVNYVLPISLVSYALFIFFLLSKLDSDFEQEVGNIEPIILINQKTNIDYALKNDALSDIEIKRLFSNQFQNITIINNSIDSLRIQTIKLNQNQYNAINSVKTHILMFKNQSVNIFYHAIILILSVIITFYLKILT